MVPRDHPPRDNVTRDNVPQDNLPRDNPPRRQSAPGDNMPWRQPALETTCPETKQKPKRQNNVAGSYFLLLCQGDKEMLL